MQTVNKKQASRLYAKKGRSGYYMLTSMRKATNYVVDKYASRCGRGKIVDFGCGCSPYQPLFGEHFDEYIRADIACSDDKDIELNDDGTLPLEDHSCNAVVSTQVLEHVNDVDIYLKECKRVLKDEGWLFLSTHGYWKYHPSPTDFWRWTRDGLKKKLEEYGFKEIEILGLIGPEASGLQLFSLSFEKHFHGSLKRVFRRISHFFMWIFDKHSLDNQDAGVYYCVMQKK